MDWPLPIELEQAVFEMKATAATKVYTETDMMQILLSPIGPRMPAEHVRHILTEEGHELRLQFTRVGLAAQAPTGRSLYILSIGHVKGRDKACVPPSKEDAALVTKAFSSRPPDQPIQSPLGRSAQFLWIGDL